MINQQLLQQEVTAISTKSCAAYCTALAYNIKGLYQELSASYVVKRYKNLIHLEIGEDEGFGDAFLFPYGTLVAWNVSEKNIELLFNELKPFEEQPLKKPEKELFSYTIGDCANLKNDRILLNNEETITKMAFSHGIAQSIRLSLFEESISNTIQKTKHLPQHLARYGKIPLSRKAIRRQVGELFMERSTINLHLDLLDTPEFFWEHPQFEPLYIQMAEELDLKARTRALNQQLDVLHNMFEMLSTEWSDQHSNRLEWAIIWLIIIEVALIFTHDILKVI